MKTILKGKPKNRAYLHTPDKWRCGRCGKRQVIHTDYAGGVRIAKCGACGSISSNLGWDGEPIDLSKGGVLSGETESTEHD